MMTPKEKDVFEFILHEVSEKRPFPTIEAITAHMGCKQTTSARTVLRTLAGQGHLKRYFFGSCYHYELLD